MALGTMLHQQQVTPASHRGENRHWHTHTCAQAHTGEHHLRVGREAASHQGSLLGWCHIPGMMLFARQCLPELILLSG